MKKNIILTTIFILLSTGVTDAMSIFSSDFQKTWNELSQNVIKLNEYTATHQNIQLENIKVESLNLDKAIFNGGIFEEVTFENISAKASKYHDMKFIKCKFYNCRYWNAEFVNVEFEDCEFINTSFLGSHVVNVKITDCKGVEAEFDDLSGSELVVENSVFNDRSSFTDSKIPLVFRNTTLSGVNMMGLSGNHSLTIEAGVLDEVNFGKSHFSDVTLRRVKQGEGGIKFNDISANSIRFEDVNMTRGTAIARSQVKSVSVNGGNFGTTFDDSIIGQIFIRDANLYYMEFSEVKLPKVTITNCKLYDTGMSDGYIEEFAVYNSEFNIIVGENFKADIVIWDNITLDGKIDLTNAQIKDFRPTRLKRGSRLQLITTGSNIQF